MIGESLDWIQNVAALTQETCVSTKAGGDVTIPGSISVRSRSRSTIMRSLFIIDNIRDQCYTLNVQEESLINIQFQEEPMWRDLRSLGQTKVRRRGQKRRRSCLVAPVHQRYTETADWPRRPLKGATQSSRSLKDRWWTKCRRLRITKTRFFTLW